MYGFQTDTVRGSVIHILSVGASILQQSAIAEEVQIPEV